jgi:hypothetical protein
MTAVEVSDSTTSVDPIDTEGGAEVFSTRSGKLGAAVGLAGLGVGVLGLVIPQPVLGLIAGILALLGPMVILRTAPGYNLWVSGPVNHFKDGIQAMSALIESDWLPFTFSMNWKITRPDTTLHFRKGEPFCAFFPLERGVIERSEPKLRPLNDDPALEKAYWSARVDRNVATSTVTDDKNRFQNWYAKGATPGEPDKARATQPRATSPKAFK